MLNDSNKCHSSYSSHILAVPSRDSANDAWSDDATTTGNTSGMTHDEIIAHKLSQWPSKKTNFKSPPDCWWSEVGHGKKGYVDLSDKSGNTVLCILCQDGKGKTDGVIALRRPFSK